MRAIVSISVAVAITLHAVLGCCWHHAHEMFVDGAEVQSHSEPAELASGCRCHHHLAKLPGAEKGPSERHDSDDSCPKPCGEKCHNVAIVRVHQDDASILAPIDFLPLTVRPIVEPVLVTSRFELDTIAVAPPPLRLHLLHQLLLI